jgi:hypothetical protein
MRKLEGFRRLDHLTRAIEEDRDPFADSSAAVPRFRERRPLKMIEAVSVSSFEHTTAVQIPTC